MCGRHNIANRVMLPQHDPICLFLFVAYLAAGVVAAGAAVPVMPSDFFTSGVIVTTSAPEYNGSVDSNTNVRPFSLPTALMAEDTLLITGAISVSC